MGTTIATLAVQLTANIGGFAVGMGKAVKPLADFGGHVVGVTAKIGGLASAAATLATGGGLAILIHSAAEGIDVTAKLSDRLGIATESLGGLQHGARLAHIGNEELTTGLEKMLKTLGEAASGDAGASAALAKLGLDAKALANAAPDEAFKSIAEGLKNIHNPAERATATLAIFGKAGQGLLPLLMQGKEGIEAAQKEAEKLGITFNRLDAAKVEAANDAMTKVGEVVTGVGQSLAIQLAPFVEAAANKLTDMGTSGEGMGHKVINAFEWVLSSVAKAADYLEALKAGWYVLRGAAGIALFGITKALSVLLQGMDWLLEKLGRTKTGWGDNLGKLADAMKEETADAFTKAGESWQRFEQGVNSKAAAKAIDEIRSKANDSAGTIAKNAEAMKGAAASTEDWKKKMEELEQNAKKVTETLVELRKSVATFGMSDSDKKLFDLKALGATPDQMNEAKALVEQLKKLEAVKAATDAIKDAQKSIRQFDMSDGEKKLDDLKVSGVSPELLQQAQRYLAMLDKLNETKKRAEQLQSEGQAVFEQTRNPMEKYEQQIGKLSDLLNSGAIDWETYGRAVKQAREQLESASKTEAPQLFKSGSAEAQRFIYDSTKGSRKLDKDEVPRKSLQEQQESRRILLRIENNLKDQAATTETVVSI